MKPLSDQISRGQSLVHAQKTARDQLGPATDRRPFGDFNKTFLRPLRPLCDCQIIWSQSDRIAVASYVWQGFNVADKRRACMKHLHTAMIQSFWTCLGKQCRSWSDCRGSQIRVSTSSFPTLTRLNNNLVQKVIEWWKTVAHMVNRLQKNTANLTLSWIHM